MKSGVLFGAPVGASLLAGLILLVHPAAAQSNLRPPNAVVPDATAPAPPLTNPGDDFKKQFNDLKKQLEMLGGQIKKGAGEIEALTSPDAARKEISTLQKLIAKTLGLVADNGDVAVLGRKVTEFAAKKEKQFEASGKFTPEERQYLRNEWKKVGQETKAAIGALSSARSKLTGMLKTVQSRGDYIKELEALNNAKKMLEVVKSLALELRTASSALETFSKTAKPPGAGM